MTYLQIVRRVWLIGVAGMLFGMSAGAADGGRVPLPTLTHGKGEHCVEPTDVIRRNHMKFLLHHRDETVHEGIRTKKYSLVECIDCHVTPGPDGQPVSIESRDHFCNSCHSYAGVRIDCFECHSSQPSGSSPSPHATGHAAAPAPETAPRQSLLESAYRMLTAFVARGEVK